jgi:hypothetical protein
VTFMIKWSNSSLSAGNTLGAVRISVFYCRRTPVALVC